MDVTTKGGTELNPSAPATPAQTTDNSKELKALRRMADSLQFALNAAEGLTAEKIYVVILRSWEPAAVEEVSEAELPQLLIQLRTELVSKQQTDPAYPFKLNIFLFAGRQLFLQNWPSWGVLDGNRFISIEGISSVASHIDRSGSLEPVRQFSEATKVIKEAVFIQSTDKSDGCRPAGLGSDILPDSGVVEDVDYEDDEEEAEEGEDPTVT